MTSSTTKTMRRGYLILACSVLSFGLAAPAGAELGTQDYSHAERLATTCGHQEVWSAGCASGVDWSGWVRMGFLDAARKRGATVQQLKSLNWVWQIAGDKARRRLAIIRRACPPAAADLERLKAARKQSVAICTSGGWSK